MNLIVAPSPPPTTIGSVTTSICPGGSYTWPANVQTYTTAQSGITVLSGCNTATLNLTITPATTIGSVTTSICPGDSYTWILDENYVQKSFKMYVPSMNMVDLEATWEDWITTESGALLPKNHIVAGKTILSMGDVKGYNKWTQN